ncbi:hypothetical protein IJ818_04505 [bacterium]|nr:hypothetical protein [bacterium]
MKKIILLLALILINTQTVFAIQEKTLNESMGGPSLEELSRPIFIRAKTEEEKLQEQEDEKKFQESQIIMTEEYEKSSLHSRGNSIKPIQFIRLKIKKASIDRKNRKNGIVADEEEIIEEPQTKLLLECKEMEYLADLKEIQARGGAKLSFPEQNITATADTMIYNQKDNLVKMIDNVVVKRGDNDEMTGDYMQIDLNEEIGILDNIKSSGYAIETVAEKGIMYGDKTIQENGHLTISKPFNIRVRSGMYGDPDIQYKDEDKYTYEDMTHNSKFVIKSSHIIVNSKKDLDKITLKNLEVYRNGKRIVKLPSTTLYQNKEQDYFEGNYPEIGSRSKLGMFIGPGVVFELPKGAIFKAIPMLNYQGKLGIGGIGKFRSATNYTEVGYGSAADLFTVKGRQELDNNLYVNYGMNSYIDNGFLGQGWAKYAADVVYEKRNNITNFMGKNRNLHFEQIVSAGYIQDDGSQENYDSWNKHMFDKNHKKLESNDIGTARLRYMIDLYQNIYHHESPEKLFFADLYIYLQGAASVYGTGDTQFVGRIGPMLRTQCKYWVQDIGYYQSAYHDETPIPIFDAYRYGKANVYLRESIKVSKMLMLSWYGSANLSDDAPDGRLFQESKFVIGIGPDDLRLNLGWDAVRQNTYIGFTIDMDAKGSEIYYDKMEIKNPDNFGQKDKHGLQALENIDESEELKYNVYRPVNNDKKVYLEKCQVIDIEDSSLRMENEQL